VQTARNQGFTGKQKFSGIAVCSAERRSLSLNRTEKSLIPARIALK
jgi:hypothetical protein